MACRRRAATYLQPRSFHGRRHTGPVAFHGGGAASPREHWRLGARCQRQLGLPPVPGAEGRRGLANGGGPAVFEQPLPSVFHEIRDPKISQNHGKTERLHDQYGSKRRFLRDRDPSRFSRLLYRQLSRHPLPFGMPANGMVCQSVRFPHSDKDGGRSPTVPNPHRAPAAYSGSTKTSGSAAGRGQTPTFCRRLPLPPLGISELPPAAGCHRRLAVHPGVAAPSGKRSVGLPDPVHRALRAHRGRDQYGVSGTPIETYPDFRV